MESIAKDYTVKELEQAVAMLNAIAPDAEAPASFKNKGELTNYLTSRLVALGYTVSRATEEDVKNGAAENSIVVKAIEKQPENSPEEPKNEPEQDAPAQETAPVVPEVQTEPAKPGVATFCKGELVIEQNTKILQGRMYIEARTSTATYIFTPEEAERELVTK